MTTTSSWLRTLIFFTTLSINHHLVTSQAFDQVSNSGVLLKNTTVPTLEIDEFIEQNRVEYNIPAVSLAIIKDGQIVYAKNYGVKNSITREPVDDQSVFEAASISKPVFAYVVCRLAQEGEIDLDAPIHQRFGFPEIANSPGYHRMTARHILTHVSGFPNWGAKLIHEPGTTYGYSGQGFEYLTKALARTYTNKMNRIISGYLEEYVLDPFEMSNTFYVKSRTLKKRCVDGHLENKPNDHHFPTDYEMAFGMHANATDIALFAIGMLNRVGLEEKMAHEMFTIHTPMPDHEKEFDTEYEQGYGLGFYIRDSPYGMVFGHSGSNYDFECLFEVYDELKMGYVIMTNSDSGDQLTFKMANFLIEGIQEKQTR